MDELERSEAKRVEAEAEKRQVIFARFWMLAEGDDFEVVERETVRIADLGLGMSAVTIWCRDYGEEADLLDMDGHYLGRVICDGSIEWGV